MTESSSGLQFGLSDILAETEAGAGVEPVSREQLEVEIESVKGIEGFPDASLEQHLEASLPPLYTTFPNPNVGAFVKGTMDERREFVRTPTGVDVAAGKNDPIYFAHYYSTKVPHQAIVPFILDFTEPGEVVFDGFCGTGMTAVAAQACAHSANAAGGGTTGARKALVSDLSPAATFIAAMTNRLREVKSRLDIIEQIVKDVAATRQEFLTTAHVGWPRGTTDPVLRVNAVTPKGQPGKIEYTVWSDVFSCPQCTAELIYWDLVFRGPGKAQPTKLQCTSCGAEVNARSLDRVWQSVMDTRLGTIVRQARQVPVLINYSVGKRRYEKRPDPEDIRCIEDSGDVGAEVSVPSDALPAGVNTAQPAKSHGFTHVHHFFTERNLVLMGDVWERVRQQEDPTTRLAGLFILTGAIQRVCRLNRYMPNHDRHVGPLSGTLYVAPLTVEIPATNYLLDRVKAIHRIRRPPSGDGVMISTQSATDLSNVPSECVDYIFTDPPFGGNLNYSELNSLVEPWLGVRTKSEAEAVVNEVQGKGLTEYQVLMEAAFSEFFRVLKPGRYMTVEFHNSQNSVWKAIQESLQRAGFVISYVRTLDKKKGTTKQLSYRATVKQDLVITAYRPTEAVERSVELVDDAHADNVWVFVRDHLGRLPVPETKSGVMEVLAERQAHLLFDRMVAAHVQRARVVPLSAVDFYDGLEQRYPSRDGMYFLPEQVAGYDRKRARAKKLQQLELFVSDEASAIQWVRQQLLQKPRSFQDLQPQFMKELRAWAKHEQTVELQEILEHNFLLYQGEEPVPSQIHSYLSTEYKDLRGLQKDDPGLIAKASGRWYVPDHAKAGDLEKVRAKALLKEYETYKGAKKKLKQFRTEAVRAGFKAAYDTEDYGTIVSVAEKIPDNVVQEDDKLLMYYDVALMRQG